MRAFLSARHGAAWRTSRSSAEESGRSRACAYNAFRGRLELEATTRRTLAAVERQPVAEPT